MKITALLLLFACSTWAEDLPLPMSNALQIGDTIRQSYTVPKVVKFTYGSPRMQVTMASTNPADLHGHGDFSIQCVDEDGTTWVAKWKRQKENAVSPPPLPGGRNNFIAITNQITAPPTTVKAMALRKTTMPPLPPNTGVTSVEPQRIVLDKHGFIVFNSEKPQKPHPRPNIPERTGLDVEKERARIAAMLGEKSKAVSTGILYPYEVKELNHFFDTPDDWTGWLIQTRGPRDEYWSNCGESAKEPTRGCTVAGVEGHQYRLMRTAP